MIALLFSPAGRVGRRDWWAGGTFAGVFSTVALLLVPAAEPVEIDPLAAQGGGSALPDAETLVGLLLQPGVLLVALVLIATWYVQICLTTKRLHDRGLSGWWQLVGLIPVAGQIWLLVVCGFREGEPDANRFGQASRAQAAAEAWSDAHRLDDPAIDALIARHAAGRSPEAPSHGRDAAPAASLHAGRAPASRAAAGGFGRRQAPPR